MNRSLAIALGGLVLAAIAGGLWLAGNPFAVRAMRQDNLRLVALHSVERALRCDMDDEVLPPDIGEPVIASFCGRLNIVLDLTDPVSGEPFRFEPIGPTSYRVCTTFNDLAALDLSAEQKTGLDMETGCLEADIRG